MFKIYCYSVSLFLVDLIMLGFVLPQLLSANDYITAGLGMLLVLCMFPLNVWFVSKIKTLLN